MVCGLPVNYIHYLWENQYFHTEQNSSASTELALIPDTVLIDR